MRYFSFSSSSFLIFSALARLNKIFSDLQFLYFKYKITSFLLTPLRVFLFLFSLFLFVLYLSLAVLLFFSAWLHLFWDLVFGEAEDLTTLMEIPDESLPFLEMMVFDQEEGMLALGWLKIRFR